MSLCWQLTLSDLVKVWFEQEGIDTLGNYVPIYTSIQGVDYDISVRTATSLCLKHTIFKRTDAKLLVYWEGEEDDPYSSQVHNIFIFFPTNQVRVLVLELFDRNDRSLFKKKISVHPSVYA